MRGATGATVASMLAWAVLAAAASGPAWAHGDGHPAAAAFDRARALAYSRDAIGRRLGDYRLLDSRGHAVSLAGLRGKPLVVSLIYTSCAHSCPIVTQTLARAVEVGREALGAAGFTVATIGFDTRADRPDRMRAFARAQGVDLPGWLFLTGDAASIEALTRDLGFLYVRSPSGFDHVTQTTILDADGRVYAQVYGEAFDPPTLVEPLRRLAIGAPAGEGALAGLLERVRLICTAYDPASGRYRFDYSLIVVVLAGTASLAAVAVFLLRAWRQTHAHERGA